MNFQVPIHYGAFTRRRTSTSPASTIVWPSRGSPTCRAAWSACACRSARLNHFTAASGADIVRGASRARRSRGRSALHRAGRPADSPRADRQDRRPDAAAQRLSRLRVHPQHAIRCSGRSTSRPRRTARSTSPTCTTASSRKSNWTRPGSYLRRKIEQYQLDKVIAHGRIWRLRFDGAAGRAGDAGRSGGAGDSRDSGAAGDGARSDAAADARRDAGAARRASQPRRTAGGATPRSSCSCCGRTSRSCRRSRRWSRSSDNLVARFHALWTLEGLGALDAGARARADEGPQPAHARAGDSRERDALQSRRPVVRRRLSRHGQGRRSGRRAPGAADAEPLQAAERRGPDQGDDGGEQGQGRPGDRPQRAAAHRQRRADGGGVLRPSSRSS